MTHDTLNTETENAGSRDAVYHLINITSLDSAGVEQYDPEAEAGITGADDYGVSVRGQEDETVAIVYDTVDAELKVKNIADGTDVANNTAVGEVLLETVGY